MDLIVFSHLIKLTFGRAHFVSRQIALACIKQGLKHGGGEGGAEI